MVAKTINDLIKKSISIRINILRAIMNSNSLHISSAYSVADIINYLYHIKWYNDKIILSKWHASCAYYATLVEYWFLDKEEFINSYSMNWSRFSWHITLWSNKEIAATAWSLWHWLSIWIWLALWDADNHIYVILWDWELNEWSIWEAFMFISQHKLKNLTIIIDNNWQQWCWETRDIIDTSYMKSIGNLFLFNTLEILWNSYESIVDGFSKRNENKTNLIIANTVKWSGISFMENNIKFHYMAPNDEEFKDWLIELQSTYEKYIN